MRGSSALLESPKMSARAAMEALPAADQAPSSVTGLSVDGLRFFVSFVLDAHEDQRRRRIGVGAVSDRRLLHALWELPEGIPVRWDDVSSVDAETLRQSGQGLVDGAGDLVRRSYRPVCRVTTVAVVAARLGDAVRRVGELPPIFRRLAVATGARPPARGDIDSPAATASAAWS